MKITLAWLRNYIDLPASVTELEKLLTFAGIEVEAVKHIKALPQSVISARVVSAEPVPKSDHLHCCMVDIGDYHYAEKTADGLIQVICGAPNCRAGLMAVIALPGTELEGITIAKAKIRGVESHGMLCSERELGISDNHGGIIELPEDMAIGISANELYNLPDTIFELEITPNRPDLLGYIGIARDLSAKLNVPLKTPELTLPKASGDAHIMPLKLINKEPELCPRYMARLFNKVQIKESPLWMKSALIKSGLRPINNIVDITNYVLLEFGHPLHAFDYTRLSPEQGDNINCIVIRKSEEKEAFTALDGKSYVMDGDELFIADGVKASALAGVMGGLDSAINANTNMIVLESAAFHPGCIRKTSYKHKISTDSSYRFERHLSDHAVENASLRASRLICELAEAEMIDVVYDNWNSPSKPMVLGIRPKRYEQLIGYSLEGDRIREYLEKLGLSFIQYGDWIEGNITDFSAVVCHHMEEMKQGVSEYSEQPDCVHTLYFKIPPSRVDLEREIDLIEEIARLDGYDKVPQKTLPGRIMDRHAYKIKRQISDYVVSRGCFETLNYSFSDPDLMLKLGYCESDPEMNMIKLLNPQSGNMSVLRTSLIPHLLQNMAYNINRGEKNVKLFEMGKTYVLSNGNRSEPIQLCAAMTGNLREEHWQEPQTQLGVSYVRGMMDELLSLTSLSGYDTEPISVPFLSDKQGVAYKLNGELLGYWGKLSAPVAESFGINLIDLKQEVWILYVNADVIASLTRQVKLQYMPIPRYPAVTRDVSFLIDNNVSYSDIVSCITYENKHLICDVKVFDEYRGKQVPSGLRSLSIRIKFQDAEKTLTDEQVDELLASIKLRLTDKWQINLR